MRWPRYSLRTCFGIGKRQGAMFRNFFRIRFLRSLIVENGIRSAIVGSAGNTFRMFLGICFSIYLKSCSIIYSPIIGGFSCEYDLPIYSLSDAEGSCSSSGVKSILFPQEKHFPVCPGLSMQRYSVPAFLFPQIRQASLRIGVPHIMISSSSPNSANAAMISLFFMAHFLFGGNLHTAFGLLHLLHRKQKWVPGSPDSPTRSNLHPFTRQVHSLASHQEKLSSHTYPLRQKRRVNSLFPCHSPLGYLATRHSQMLNPSLLPLMVSLLVFRNHEVTAAQKPDEQEPAPSPVVSALNGEKCPAPSRCSLPNSFFSSSLGLHDVLRQQRHRFGVGPEFCLPLRRVAKLCPGVNVLLQPPDLFVSVA